MIVKLDEYKRAKTLVRDLTELSTLFTSTITSFARYKKYTPVKLVLVELLAGKVVIRRHLIKYKAVLESCKK